MLAQMQLQKPAGLSRPLARRTLAVRAVARPTHHSARPATTTDAAAPVAAAARPLALAAFAAAAPLLIHADAALATGGAFGLLEGRSAALVHPAVMLILFTLTGYAGFLGWQWRRTRTIGDDIKALKAQLPKVAEGETAPPSPVAGQVAALEQVGGGWFLQQGCVQSQPRAVAAAGTSPHTS